MIDALRIERKEWTSEMREVADNYRDEMRTASEAKVVLQSEMHALRNKVQELILKVESLLMRSGGDKPKDGHD